MSISLKREQPPFGVHAASEAGHRTRCSQHPMARDNDRDRVGTVGPPHCSRTALDSDRLGLSDVAARLPERNVTERRPGFSLKRRPQRARPKLEVLTVSIEILAELCTCRRTLAPLRLKHRTVPRRVLQDVAHPSRRPRLKAPHVARIDTRWMLRAQADRVKFDASCSRNSLGIGPECPTCPLGASIVWLTARCRW